MIRRVRAVVAKIMKYIYASTALEDVFDELVLYLRVEGDNVLPTPPYLSDYFSY